MWRERRMIASWCEERRGYGVVYIGDSSSTMKETTEHCHSHDTQRIKEMWTKIGVRGAMGVAATPWVRPHPQVLPLD
jgi:hypothetical protein